MEKGRERERESESKKKKEKEKEESRGLSDKGVNQRFLDSSRKRFSG